MSISTTGKQLVSRAQSKLSGFSRAQLQKQITAYRQLDSNPGASGTNPIVGNSKDISQQYRLNQSRPLAKGPMSLSKPRSAGAQRSPGRLNSSRDRRRSSNGAGDQPIMHDQEKLRQDMANLAQTLYGSPVTGQVGPNGEIYFASDRNRYAGIGYGRAGTNGSDRVVQTSFELTPPFEESVVSLTCTTDHEPIVEPVSFGAPSGARIINFVSSPYPTAHDAHAIVLVGGVVPIPPGFSTIHVTTKATIQSSMQVSSAGPDATSACHFFRATLEGPGFSPQPLGDFREWMMGTTPPDLHPVPQEETISLSWNLGGRHGDFLVLVGLAGLYHCMGVGSDISAGFWIDVSSIRIDVE